MHKVLTRARSSAAERYLDAVEVTGSNPVGPTNLMTPLLITRYNRGMTHTPIPTPLPQEVGYMVTCDGCRTTQRVAEQGDIPAGWKTIYLRGWVGAFHACSELCKERIVSTREINSVPRFPIIIVN